MYGAMLPEIHRRQMKTEQLHGAPQAAQPAARHARGTVAFQRIRDQLKVAHQLGRIRVRRDITFDRFA